MKGPDSMPNLFDYLSWRGDLPLSAAPFNDVDSLILCALCHVRLDGLVPAPGEPGNVTVARAAERLFAARTEPLPDADTRDFDQHNLLLLDALSRTPRFMDLPLSGYVSRHDTAAEEQFAALAVDLGGGEGYLAFRGTDSSLVGWKEDFNLGFQDTVPGQWTACYYLSNMASLAAGSVWVGGHSKGGNLAVFSAACTFPDITPRIRAVFNYDGPGFSQAVLDTPGYRTALPLVRTFLPQSSVVGMLLGHEESYTIVQSGLKGLMQHDPYSWEIRDGDFIRLKEITEGSCLVDRTIKTWISELSPEERRAFVDTVFDILRSSGATRTGELLLPDNVMEIIGSFLKETSVKRDNILLPLTSLLKAAGKTLTSFYLDAS